MAVACGGFDERRRVSVTAVPISDPNGKRCRVVFAEHREPLPARCRLMNVGSKRRVLMGPSSIMFASL